MKHLEVGPREIDFGRVFIYSQVERTFHLKNYNSQHVSLRLLKESLPGSLTNSYTKTQIVGPGCHAGLRILLEPLRIEKNEVVLRYSINERHVFQFLVLYECIPVFLTLSVQELTISFHEEDATF
jgi:hypothetical protein